MYVAFSLTYDFRVVAVTERDRKSIGIVEKIYVFVKEVKEESACKRWVAGRSSPWTVTDMSTKITLVRFYNGL